MVAFLRKRPHLLPCCAAAALLLTALAKLPYGYYTFMRWIVSIVAVLTAHSAYRWGYSWAIWVFGLTAVLFNPLAPIHMSRDVWCLLDFGAAAVFMAAGLSLTRRERKETVHEP